MKKHASSLNSDITLISKDVDNSSRKAELLETKGIHHSSKTSIEAPAIADVLKDFYSEKEDTVSSRIDTVLLTNISSDESLAVINNVSQPAADILNNTTKHNPKKRKSITYL